MTNRTITAVASAAAICVAHFAAMRLLVPHQDLAQQVSGPLLMAAALAAAVSCLLARRTDTGTPANAWTLIAAAALCWFFGESVWVAYINVLEVQPPVPSIGDVGFLALVPALCLGIALVIPPGGRALALLDGLIIAGSLLFITWPWLLAPVLHADGASTAATAVTLAYPVGDIALATMAILSMSRLRGGFCLSLSLVLLGILSFVVGDIGFAYLTQQGTYRCGSAVDTGWFAGFVLIAVAAWLPGAARRPAGLRQQPSPFTVAMPYLPLGAALAIWIAFYGWADKVLDVIGVSLLAVSLARQIVMAHGRRTYQHSRQAGQVRELSGGTGPAGPSSPRSPAAARRQGS